MRGINVIIIIIIIIYQAVFLPHSTYRYAVMDDVKRSSGICVCFFPVDEQFHT